MPLCSGADPIETRPGFAALLDRIEGNGVRTVIVEDASRFARELMTQELGILALIQRGVRVLTANGDDLTDSSDPSRKMMRQIAGAFARVRKGAARGEAQGRARSQACTPRAGAKAARALPRSIPRWCRSPSDCAGASAAIPCGPSLPISQPAAMSM